MKWSGLLALAALAALWLTWPGPPAASLGVVAFAVAAGAHMTGRPKWALGALLAGATSSLLLDAAPVWRAWIAAALFVLAFEAVVRERPSYDGRAWIRTAILIGGIYLASVAVTIWRPLRAAQEGESGILFAILMLAVVGALVGLSLGSSDPRDV